MAFLMTIKAKYSNSMLRLRCLKPQEVETKFVVPTGKISELTGADDGAVAVLVLWSEQCNRHAANAPRRCSRPEFPRLGRQVLACVCITLGLETLTFQSFSRSVAIQAIYGT